MGFKEMMQADSPESWRPYYLNYSELKDLVAELVLEQDECKPRSRYNSADLMDLSNSTVGRFQEMLQAELTKVNQFACVKHEDVFLALRRVCEDCRKLSPQQIKPMEDKIIAMGEDIVHLDAYVRHNYVGFQKLTEKFDLCLGMSGSALFMGGLHCEAFCNVRFDDILILLGLAWARWRSAQSSAVVDKDATWHPPESFIRNTSKYWIKPEKVVLLKTRLLKQLPYLLFGASQIDQEKLLDPFALLDLDYAGADTALDAYSGTLEESQLLSSVYFDSPDVICYQERIRREEGARLVRFRWYGENHFEDDLDVYVERKIHHEGWGGAKSAKERCVLPQKDLFQFMKGQFDSEAYFKKLAEENMFSEKMRKGMKNICNEVNTMIQGKKLQPFLRTSYYRCAFQLSTDNKVRISLDTQMSLLNEYIQGGHPSKPWCHPATDKLTKDDVYRFPYAILEIKLQDVSETPLWLLQTLADIDAIQVHKFSKFQHGMAFLHPNRVPIMPHWHKDFADWQAAKEQKSLMRRRLLTKDVKSFLKSQDSNNDLTVPDIKAILAPGGEGHLLKDMENLDPKAVFANERTLLHYAEKGMYTGALAVVLLSQDGVAKVSGGILALCTAIYYVWILSEYLDRLARITGRAKVGKDSMLRLDSPYGPLVTGSIILLVLFLTLATAILRRPKDAADHHHHHHHR